MVFEIENLEGGIKKITLDGRMDIAGANAVDLKFTSHTSGEKGAIIVDMGKVDFIASMGMRLLLKCAKAQKNRGGMLVLYNLLPRVEKAINSAGIDVLIPLHADQESAIKALQAAQ